MKLNINHFLNTGTFFDDLELTHLDRFLEQHSDAVFGESIVIYYFYFTGYSIEFIWDKDHQQLKGQQIEISQPNQIQLTELATITHDTDFETYYAEKITASYQDEEEKVIFLNNGVNAYFNKQQQRFQLTKITSPDDTSRQLVIQLMNKVYKTK